MSDPIYIVDPGTKSAIGLQPVSFADIGFKERADLEQWIVNHPELLGEPLLIVSSEYSQFDKSNRRLDILALDKLGTLVVVELKLDIQGSVADQQAIRYAAFVSNMTMAEVIELLAASNRCGRTEAEQKVLDFLGVQDVPQLDDQPRIILAAGSIYDQELTSCVLWLRRFGLDISCVELTPYRLPGESKLVLVPKVIIPLREARDFLVGTEKKQAVRAQEKRAQGETRELWTAIASAFNGFGLRWKCTRKPAENWLVLTGSNVLHYEWFLRKREACIDVAIHFQADDLLLNQQMASSLEMNKAVIEQDVGLPFKAGAFGKKWMQARFALPYSGAEPIDEIAPKAAELMKILLERTWALVEQVKQR